ncbi:acyl carrier protein [Streptomyces sp. NPDC093252]|uniref:acyl carrier protein n=1 Tax=Streptomyces sp. NPDC093252 TaxID=3154980 RepID=UPI0034191D34
MSAAAPSPALTSALTAVRTCLAAELDIPAARIAPSDQLDRLEHADSVRLMEVVARLEDRYDVEFDDDRVRAADTVADLAALVVDALEAEGR